MIRRKDLTAIDTILRIPWFEFRFGESKDEGILSSKMEIRGCFRSSADHKQLTFQDVSFVPTVREGVLRIYPWFQHGTRVYYAPAVLGVPDFAWDAHTTDSEYRGSDKRDVITGYGPTSQTFTKASLVGPSSTKRIRNGTTANNNAPNLIPSEEDAAVFAVLGAEGRLSMSIPGVDSADLIETEQRLMNGLVL